MTNVELFFHWVDFKMCVLFEVRVVIEEMHYSLRFYKT